MQKKMIFLFNSLKYSNLLSKTKVKYVVTDIKYEKFVSKFCYPIIVDNVLKSVATL